MPVGDDEERAGVVVRFAGVLIPGQLVSFIARAEVGAFGVGTRLRAKTGWIAFVNVFAAVAIPV